jgi:gluconolactonase
LAVLLVHLGACDVRAAQSAVERLDPALDALIAPDATLETLHHDPRGFFEGPTWIPGNPGHLVFSDIPGNTLYRVDAEGHAAPLLTGVQQGEKGAFFDQERQRYMLGPNGTTLSPDGRELVYCVFGGNRIEALDLHTNRRRIVVRENDASPLPHPNDLAFGPHGDLYFTTDKTLFRLHGSQLESMTSDPNPNGIAFSKDLHRMYATSHPDRIIAYEVLPDGHVAPGHTFVTMQGDLQDGFVDGVKVDGRGNVYAVGPGGVWVLSPDGKHLGTIRAPFKRFSNLTFGEPGDAALFLTAPEGVYRLRLGR